MNFQEPIMPQSHPDIIDGRTLPPPHPDFIDGRIAAARLPAPQTAAAASIYAALLGKTREEVTREFTLFMLDHCQGDRVKAADTLGLTVPGLKAILATYRNSGHAVLDDPNVEFNGFNPKLDLKVAECFAASMTNDEIAGLPEFKGASPSTIGNRCSQLRLLQRFPLAHASRQEKIAQARAIARSKPSAAKLAKITDGANNKNKWDIFDEKLGKSHTARLEDLYLTGMPIEKIAAHEDFKTFTTYGAVQQRISSSGISKRCKAARQAAIAQSKPEKPKNRNASKPKIIDARMPAPSSNPTFQLKPQRSPTPPPFARRPRTPAPFTPSPRSLAHGLDIAAEMERLAIKRAAQLEATVQALDGKVTTELVLNPAATKHQNDNPVAAFTRQLKAQGFTLLAKDQETKGPGNKTYVSDYYWHDAGILADIIRGAQLEPSLRLHAQFMHPDPKLSPVFRTISPIPSGGRFTAVTPALNGERKIACLTYSAHTVEQGITVLNAAIRNGSLILRKFAVPPRRSDSGLLTFRGSTSNREFLTNGLSAYLRDCCFPKTKARFIAQL